MGIEQLAQQLADAECIPGAEELWRYLSEIERESWRTVAKLALKLLGPAPSSVKEGVLAEGYVCDCVKMAKGGYEVHVSTDQSIPEGTRVQFVAPLSLPKHQ